MPKWTTLKAGELLPDQPDLDNPGVIVANNMVPHATGYLPLSATAVYSAALGSSADDFPRGSYAAKDASGNAYVYAGDAGALYNLSSDATWEGISKAGGYSGTGNDEVWSFADWGSWVIACKYGNKPQFITAGGAAFADLGGSPPYARHVTVVRDFVVLGGLNESSVDLPMRIRWSAYNNATLWTQSRATQSDFQDFPDGGKITGLQGGQFGIIFQETAIRRMEYFQPTIFRFDVIDREHGCKIPKSIVRYADRIYYISDEDIFVTNGMGPPQPMGAQKVIRAFWAEFDYVYASRVSAVADSRRHIIIWSYPTLGSAGVPSKWLIWNWDTNKFSTADISAYSLFSFLPEGYTLDGLDAITTDIDTLSISLDSDAFKASVAQIGGFDTNYKLWALSGTPMTGTVETGEIRAAPGRHIEITNARPLVDGGTARVQIGTRASQSDSSSWTALTSTNASGECNLRTHSRFARARIEASGSWKHLQGVDLFVRGAGTR